MQNSEFELNRRILKIGAAMSAVFYPAYALAFQYTGRPIIALACMISLLVSAGVSLWGLRRARPHAALQALLVVYFVHFSGLTWFQGGLSAPALWWLSAVPMVCLLAGLQIQGVVMAALLGFQLVAIYVAEANMALPQALALWQQPETERLLASLSACTVLTALMVASLHWRRVMGMELDRARDEAMEAVNIKARFLANMSHEIRTPLNGLVGAADLLRLESLTREQRIQLLSLQQQSSKTVLALVDDILDWSKLKAGQMTVETRPLNLCSLVFGANQLFSVTAFDKGIELSTSADPDVPPQLLGDATRLRQIVNNLVSNAVKFTTKGGVHIHVSIDKPATRLPAGHRLVRVSVSDTGIGIAPRHRDSLFDEFSQADGTITRRFGGTGLGLAICHDLAKLMGGRIEVDSTPGEGSTFSLVVPLRVGSTPSQVDTALPGAEQLDVVLACASEGLARHVGTLLREFRVRHTWLTALPTPSAFQHQGDAAHLLLVDAALLPQAPEDIGAEWRRFAEHGVTVVVMTPFSGDSVLGPIAHASLLYKPIRRSSLRSVLMGLIAGQPVSEPDSRFDTLPARMSRQVLLVEDNPVNQIVCKAMLNQVGCEVVLADNGQQALDLLAGRRFDLVLMDLQMPVMDGLTATRELRRREERERLARTPVVAMTANTEADIQPGAPGWIFDGFLAKPFVLKHLTDCLKRFPSQAGRRAA